MKLGVLCLIPARDQRINIDDGIAKPLPWAKQSRLDFSSEMSPAHVQCQLFESALERTMGKIAPKPDQFEHALILALCCCAILGSFMLRPSTHGGLELPAIFSGGGFQLPNTCMSRRMFGIPCPGCGLTRGFVSLSRGRVVEAFRLNPMSPILFALCLFQIPYRILCLFGMWEKNSSWAGIKRRLDSLVAPILIALVATWVIRLML